MSSVRASLCRSVNLKGGDRAPHRLLEVRLPPVLLRKAGSLKEAGWPEQSRSLLCPGQLLGRVPSSCYFRPCTVCEMKGKEMCVVSKHFASLQPFGGTVNLGWGISLHLHSSQVPSDHRLA